MSIRLRVLSSNEQIHIADLMDIRASYSEEDMDLASIEKRFRSELLENYNRVFFVGFNENQISIAYVQLIAFNADNDPDLANGKEIAHIHDLRVRKNFQGRGYGRLLMKQVEDEAGRRGVRILTLGVDNWNARAIHFYNKLGYKKFKETPGRTNEEICYLMQKII